MSERPPSISGRKRLVNTLGFREPEPEACMICDSPCCMEPEDVETTLVNTLSFRKKKGSHG